MMRDANTAYRAAVKSKRSTSTWFPSTSATSSASQRWRLPARRCQWLTCSTHCSGQWTLEMGRFRDESLLSFYSRYAGGAKLFRTCTTNDSRGEMYSGHGCLCVCVSVCRSICLSVCLSVCLAVPRRIPTLLQ